MALLLAMVVAEDDDDDDDTGVREYVFVFSMADIQRGDIELCKSNANEFRRNFGRLLF